jgi:hypothetical protein
MAAIRSGLGTIGDALSRASASGYGQHPDQDQDHGNTGNDQHPYADVKHQGLPILKRSSLVRCETGSASQGSVEKRLQTARVPLK